MITNEEFLKKINEVDSLFKDGTFNEKAYKIKLNSISKIYINSLKKMNYSKNYISKLLTNIKKLFSNHLILSYLKLSKEEYNEIKSKAKENMLDRNNNKKKINKNEIKSIATELLQTERFEHIYIGLLIASGRRVTELIAGNFSDTEEENVLFSGQLKTKDKNRASETYKIPLLVNKDLFFMAYYKLTNTAKFKKLVSEYNNKILPDYYIPKMLERELFKIFDSKFSLSDLRTMYTTIILEREGYYSAKKTEDFLLRIVEILGHKDIESASSNYRDFALTIKKTINNFKDKIAYIRQNRKVMLRSVVEKKFLLYKTNKNKPENKNETEKLWLWTLFRSLDSIKNEDKLLNLIEVKEKFRKILKEEIGVKVEQRATQINMFLDKILRIKPTTTINLEVKRKTKTFNKDEKREIIERDLLPKLLQDDEYKDKDIKKQNKEIYRLILSKLFIENEKYSNIINFPYLKEKFKSLPQSRFFNILKIIGNNIRLIKMSFIKE